MCQLSLSLKVANRFGNLVERVTVTICAHLSDQKAETASTIFANAVQGAR